MTERTLVELIAKENEDTIISNLDEKTKEYLKEHIQKTILERYDYKPLEHIQEMIDEVIYMFEDDLLAINYIKNINYSIDDGYYEKLKEEYFDSHDDSICDWEDEFEKQKEDIRLNKWTLWDFIKIDYVDGIDLMVDEFYTADYWKKHRYYEYYQEGIQEQKELFYKYKNIEVKKPKNRDEAISNILNREPFDDKNIQLKKDPIPLSKREETLCGAFIILTLNKGLNVVYKEKIANDYNVKNNTPQVNQELLNNSYDVIIDKLKKLPNTELITGLLENEKSINNNLFTNSKKLSKVTSNNHYMSFLYKCNSVYTDNDLIVFQEFVEALISGYMQYLEFEDREDKIKKYTHDLEVLQRYNNSNENDQNIQDLENKVSFLSIAKPHQKFIPFKELSNRLEIDTNQMANYITNILNNGTHRNTIKQSFDALRTIPKEICISRF